MLSDYPPGSLKPVHCRDYSTQIIHGDSQMKKILLFVVMLLTLDGLALAAGDGGSAASAPGLVGVHVDRVVIDTEGLANASVTLAASVDRLAQSIGQLSVDNTSLDDEQKQALLAAVKSVDEAGQALASLSRQLPQRTRELGERLPAIIDSAREPIDHLNRGLGAARDSIYTLTEALPQATANATELVNATLDAAVIRLSVYTFVLLAAIALAVIAIVWFIYWQYLGPLVRKLDELVGAPEHFNSMSRHMAQTSANLLELRRSGARGVGRLRRVGMKI